MYLQDEDANVYALSLATGKLKWEYQVNAPEKSGPGPDGVAVTGGAVYGDTSTKVFALNAATGKTIWTQDSLLNSGQGAFSVQPQVAGGRVYLASAYGSGSGGAWETPLVGSDGSVTFGTGNPYQSVGSAIASPSRDLYTDSAVNLDAATGKLRWYCQAVPDDFRDYDLQASPISASIGGMPVTLAAGKMGYVYELNARSGALRWKTPVGEHNGHDNDSLLALSHQLTIKLPYTFLPAPLGGVLSNMAVAGGRVYVATIDLPFTDTSMSTVDGSKAAGPRTGEVEALSLATTLYSGVLIALDRSTGAIVYRRQLPTSANSPIAAFGNTVLVPAGGPETSGKGGGGGDPQLVAYTIPAS